MSSAPIIGSEIIALNQYCIHSHLFTNTIPHILQKSWTYQFALASLTNRGTYLSKIEQTHIFLFGFERLLHSLFLFLLALQISRWRYYSAMSLPTISWKQLQMLLQPTVHSMSIQPGSLVPSPGRHIPPLFILYFLYI